MKNFAYGESSKRSFSNPQPCTLSSIGEGPHWLPDKVTWRTSRNHGAVMPDNPGGLRWHSQKLFLWAHSCHRDTDLCLSTRFVTTIIDLAALDGPLHRAIHFCLANGDSQQTTGLTISKQFRCAVFTIIKFAVEKCAFLFSISRRVARQSYVTLSSIQWKNKTLSIHRHHLTALICFICFIFMHYQITNFLDSCEFMLIPKYDMLNEEIKSRWINREISVHRDRIFLFSLQGYYLASICVTVSCQYEW